MVLAVAPLAAIIGNMLGYWTEAKVGSRWLAVTGRFGLTAVGIVIVVFLLVRHEVPKLGHQAEDVYVELLL